MRRAQSGVRGALFPDRLCFVQTDRRTHASYVAAKRDSWYGGWEGIKSLPPVRCISALGSNADNTFRSVGLNIAASSGAPILWVIPFFAGIGKSRQVSGFRDLVDADVRCTIFWGLVQRGSQALD